MGLSEFLAAHFFVPPDKLMEIITISMYPDSCFKRNKEKVLQNLGDLQDF